MSEDRLTERLERERPVPAAAFRGDLRRRLMKGSRGSVNQPVRTWILSYVGAGALCLVVAAVGLAGLGPFAA